MDLPTNMQPQVKKYNSISENQLVVSQGMFDYDLAALCIDERGLDGEGGTAPRETLENPKHPNQEYTDKQRKQGK